MTQQTYPVTNFRPLTPDFLSQPLTPLSLAAVRQVLVSEISWSGTFEDVCLLESLQERFEEITFSEDLDLTSPLEFSARQIVDDYVRDQHPLEFDMPYKTDALNRVWRCLRQVLSGI